MPMTAAMTIFFMLSPYPSSPETDIGIKEAKRHPRNQKSLLPACPFF
jgi:hypothetical protein